jgi:hypothetical protein
LPYAAHMQASLSRAVNQRLQQLSEAGGTLGPGRGYAVSSLPDTVLKQVSVHQHFDQACIMHFQYRKLFWRVYGKETSAYQVVLQGLKRFGYCQVFQVDVVKHQLCISYVSLTIPPFIVYLRTRWLW